MKVKPSGSKRLLLGMTNSRESAVMAILLKAQGFDVTGITVRARPPFENTAENTKICSLVREDDVARFCQQLGIAHTTIDVSEKYHAWVIDRLVHEVLRERRPNPCTWCVRQLQLNELFNACKEGGYDGVGLGYYARVTWDGTDKRYRVLQAVDVTQDQSYFLSGLSQKELSLLYLPIGDLPGKRIEALAKEYKIESLHSGTSDSECWTSNPDFMKYLESATAFSFREPGDIRHRDILVGQHKGLHHYRKGQSQGLEFNRKEDEEKELVVTSLNRRDNYLMVGDLSDLNCTQLLVSNIFWNSPVDQLHMLKIYVRVRADEKKRFPCVVTLFEGNTAHVEFATPYAYFEEGQMLVFYRGEELVGGGVIDQLIKPRILTEEEKLDQLRMKALGKKTDTEIEGL